jgi:hypothetical protein
MQYSDREMSQLSFDHLLNLSFAFHMRRKTGELLRILDRGAAINHTFEASRPISADAAPDSPFLPMFSSSFLTLSQPSLISSSPLSPLPSGSNGP